MFSAGIDHRRRIGAEEAPMTNENYWLGGVFGDDATRHSCDTSYLLVKKSIYVALQHIQTSHIRQHRSSPTPSKQDFVLDIMQRNILAILAICYQNWVFMSRVRMLKKDDDEQIFQSNECNTVLNMMQRSIHAILYNCYQKSAHTSRCIMFKTQGSVRWGRGRTDDERRWLIARNVWTRRNAAFPWY